MGVLCREFTVDLVRIAYLDLAQLCLAPSVKIKHLIRKFFPDMESFTKQKCLWRSILALIWSSQHSHLNLISRWKKSVSQSEAEIEARILSVEVRSVWETIFGFSHLSPFPLFSVALPAFYPNFPPTHLHSLIPQYVTDTGEEGGRLWDTHMQEVKSSFII